jgi:hypothetical protein
MRVDDSAHLSQVWLIDGPGPEAVWPLALSGRYVEFPRFGGQGFD